MREEVPEVMTTLCDDTAADPFAYIISDLEFLKGNATLKNSPHITDVEKTAYDIKDRKVFGSTVEKQTLH